MLRAAPTDASLADVPCLELGPDGETRFRQMADTLPQMVWVCRPDGYHEYYNKRWYEFTGAAEGTTDGMLWDGIFHPDDQRASAVVWQECLRTGEPYEYEYRLRDATGEYRWVLGRAQPLRDARGAIIKWFGTCTLIDDQKRVERELRDARDAAEAASVAKSEFLANMSHEIRTPMNAIIGLANILERSALDNRQTEYVTTLKSSANSLLDLINDLLDIAKIEARGIELQNEPFAFAALLEDITRMMQLRAREKGLSLATRLDPALAPRYVGDVVRLRQVLINLCGNAIKFTDQGGITMTVTLLGTPGDTHRVAIEVADTGIGIAAAKLETIFDKFVQADSSINRRFGGTGLGLAIARTLAEAMGGGIHVASTPGQGSRFTVTLPLMPDRRSIARLEPESETPAETLSGKRVLLVEDHAPNILVATTILQQLGYAYDSVTNAEDAMERLRHERYDAVLMDVQMPGMDGLQATALIRRREAERQAAPVPILGMTAHALAGDRERCLEAGMDDYLSKPFHPDELQGKLAALLQTRA